ncbi:MAG: hypothetical protein QOE60_1698 [Thermoleophilaceae bacterium]|jgi:hypothetical protein|nr:hypothetical protein [Thermoleophilaceae bacterium]
MTSLRLALVAASILAGFIPVTVAVAQAPVEWYTDTGGGGALAQPGYHAHDGGAVGPMAPGAPGDQPAPDNPAPPIVAPPTATPPVATAAQADRPEAPASPPRAEAAQATPTVTGGQNQQSSDAGLIGALPLTGLQLAGVAGAGLCLLLAGALLRPRRRTAAPR